MFERALKRAREVEPGGYVHILVETYSESDHWWSMTTKIRARIARLSTAEIQQERLRGRLHWAIMVNATGEFIVAYDRHPAITREFLATHAVRQNTYPTSYKLKEDTPDGPEIETQQ